MNQVPTKIVLKSTTRMSLNDRFSTIMPSVQSIRANKAAEQQVSVANRRLAQQLANRPGIPQNQVNNMMMYNNNNMMNNNNNLMMMNNMRGQGRGRRGAGPGLIQNRVGPGNIKARLTLPGAGGRGGAQRGARGGGNYNMNYNNNNNSNNSLMAMTPFNNRQWGRGALATRSPRGRGALRGGRGQQFNRDGPLSGFSHRYPGGREKGFPPSSSSPFPSGSPPRFRRGGRGGYQGARSRGGHGVDNRFTGQATGRGMSRGGARGGMGGANMQGGGVRGRGNFANNSNRGGGRFNSRGRGGRGGRGRGAGNNDVKTSVADLDSQLDQYMAKTKSSLDSELDAYMAHVSTD